MALANTLILIVNDRINLFIEKLATTEEQKIRMFSIWQTSKVKSEEIRDIQNDKIMTAFATKYVSYKKPSCIHRLITGKNKGSMCGKSISKKSKTGSFCLSHIKNEIIQDISEDSETINTTKIMERANIVLFKTLGGYLIDPVTKLAFNSDKIVIGKDVKGKIIPLDFLDIDFCTKQMIDYKSV